MNPRGDDGWPEINAADYLAKILYIDDDDPVDTGIIDLQGNPVMRQIVKPPIGFVHHCSAKKHAMKGKHK